MPNGPGVEADEATWVTKAQDGSKEAFAQLVRLHQAHIRALLARYVRSWDMAEDLAQETFLSAFRGIAGYRWDASFRTWLLGIARNQALKHLRDEGTLRHAEPRSLEEAVDRWLAEDFHAKAEGMAGHAREVAALQECVKSLPEGSARLVSEHYLNRTSAVEIARRTGKKESAIRMTLFRIRHALRRCMDLRLSEAGHE